MTSPNDDGDSLRTFACSAASCSLFQWPCQSSTCLIASSSPRNFAVRTRFLRGSEACALARTTRACAFACPKTLRVRPRRSLCVFPGCHERQNTLRKSLFTHFRRNKQPRRSRGKQKSIHHRQPAPRYLLYIALSLDRQLRRDQISEAVALKTVPLNSPVYYAIPVSYVLQ